MPCSIFIDCLSPIHLSKARNEAVKFKTKINEQGDIEVIKYINLLIIIIQEFIFMHELKFPPESSEENIEPRQIFSFSLYNNRLIHKKIV